MIDYPQLRISLDYDLLNDYGLTIELKDKLKGIVLMPELLFNEFESREFGFLILPKDFELKGNDLIYLAIGEEDELLEDFGMGCIAFVSEIFQVNSILNNNFQIITVGFSNLV